ncbi:MAG: AAA family ATPase [Lachnospiraceae bacterium]|nr:AAA family ATPase [Lachnospiraceae bacterium]
MEQKIAIIGYSGSGKSTLAQKLGKKYNCDVLYLDCVHWLPGWKERQKEDTKKIVSDFLDTHPSWVIDGNYKSVCFNRRMEEASHIIFLKFPIHICLYRAVKRYFTYRGQSRFSMADGCNEKIDKEFLWWIIHEGRDKTHQKRYQKLYEKYPKKLIVLKNPRAVKKFTQKLSLM